MSHAEPWFTCVSLFFGVCTLPVLPWHIAHKSLTSSLVTVTEVSFKSLSITPAGSPFSINRFTFVEACALWHERQVNSLPVTPLRSRKSRREEEDAPVKALNYADKIILKGASDGALNESLKITNRHYQLMTICLV
jgi:hypothetical protein